MKTINIESNDEYVVVKTWRSERGCEDVLYAGKSMHDALMTIDLHTSEGSDVVKEEKK